jgi:hypothetical protein
VVFGFTFWRRILWKAYGPSSATWLPSRSSDFRRFRVERVVCGMNRRRLDTMARLSRLFDKPRRLLSAKSSNEECEICKPSKHSFINGMQFLIYLTKFIHFFQIFLIHIQAVSIIFNYELEEGQPIASFILDKG